MLSESILCLFLIDTNECLLSNSGCSQLCTNTIGSYQCNCRNGYQLNTNGIDCDGQILNFSAFISCSFQISMSVLMVLIYVNTIVITLMVVMSVIVNQATNYQMD